MKKTIFCAMEQKDTEHTFTIEGTTNKEIIARCDTCNHLVKFQHGISKDDLNSWLETYRVVNKGQIPAPTPEAVEAELKKLEELLS